MSIIILPKNIKFNIFLDILPIEWKKYAKNYNEIIREIIYNTLSKGVSGLFPNNVTVEKALK